MKIGKWLFLLLGAALIFGGCGSGNGSGANRQNSGNGAKEEMAEENRGEEESAKPDSEDQSFDVDWQLQIFAECRDQWAAGQDYANDVFQFALTDLDYDGNLELVTASYGGTGHYTYSHFYVVGGAGSLKELETPFTEAESQPDLLWHETLTLYRGDSPEGTYNDYIVEDEERYSAAQYNYSLSALSLREGKVLCSLLAKKTVVYEGENGEEKTSCEDFEGNVLTEEEYEEFAESYYAKQDCARGAVSLCWMDVAGLEGKSGEETAALLKESWQGFSRK